MFSRRLLTVCVMLISILVAIQFVESDNSEAASFTEGDYTYEITSNNTVSIKEYNGSAVADIAIPNTVYYNMSNYTVTGISNNAFKNSGISGLLIIPTSVHRVGESSFSGCNGITIIDMKGVNEVGDNAFKGCTGIIEVRFGNGISSVGTDAFDIDFVLYESALLGGRPSDYNDVKDAADLRGSRFILNGGELVKQDYSSRALVRKKPVNCYEWQEETVMLEPFPQGTDGAGRPYTLEGYRYALCEFASVDDTNANHYIVDEHTREIPDEYGEGTIIQNYWTAYYYRFYYEGIHYEITSTIKDEETVKVIGCKDAHHNYIPNAVHYADRTFRVDTVENVSVDEYNDGDCFEIPVGVTIRYGAGDFLVTGDYMSSPPTVKIVHIEELTNIPTVIDYCGVKYTVTEIASGAVCSISAINFYVPEDVTINDYSFVGFVFYNKQELLPQSSESIGGYYYYVSDDDPNVFFRSPIYDVNFYDWDGTLLFCCETPHKCTPDYLGPSPERATDVQFIYTFTGWSPSLSPINGDTDYTASYSGELREYTVTFLDEDGTQLCQTNYGYGTLAADIDKPIATKSSDDTYTYVFDAWTPVVSDVNGNATYTASYNNIRQYSITFLNEDGTQLSQNKYLTGTPATDIIKPIAIKSSTNQYSYVFNSWTPDVKDVSEDAVYTATFNVSIRQYSVTFLNEDGSQLSQRSYNYGTPAVDIIIPIASKSNTQQYVYNFNGWDQKIADVLSDATYTATYTQSIRSYTITFMSDGDVFETKQVPFGGDITLPSNIPVKTTTLGKKYSFVGWNGYSPDIVVDRDRIFEALFSSTDSQYLVQFKSDGVVVDARLYDYGEVIVKPDNPSKGSDSEYTYSFTSWSGFADNMVVDKDYTFVAEYERQLKEYTIKFVVDEAVYYEQTLHYNDSIIKPSDPSKEVAGYDYLFTGWNGYYGGIKVNGEMTFTAQFSVSIESIESLIAESVETKTIVVEVPKYSSLTLQTVDVNKVLESLNSDESYRFMMSGKNGKISFDKNSFQSFEWGDVNMEIDLVSELTEKESKKLLNRPVYDIDITNSKGKVKKFMNGNIAGSIDVTLPYTLKDGEDKDRLCIWYVEDGEIKETHSCVYFEEGNDGYVTFKTTHLSNYAVGYEESGGDNNMTFIVAGGIGLFIVSVVAITSVWIKKRV